MKTPYLFSLAIAAMMLFPCNNISKADNGNKNPATETNKDNGTFKQVDILKNFTENPFTFFTGAPILLAGDRNSYNAMTIGWGAMGSLWGGYRPTITVYVAQKRYTHVFMEKAKYFTVMTFKDPKIAAYMGHHSGRKVDKAKALGVHVAYTDNGTPYFQEALTVFECEIMYGEQLKESGFRNAVPKKQYANFPDGIHSMYIGEVVNVWKKQE